MPDIELGPNDYRVTTPRRFRWPSLDTRARLISLTIACAALLYVYSAREQVSSGTLFGVTAIFAFGAGIFLAVLLRDRH